MQIESMDKLRVRTLRPGKTFEDTSTEVCKQISKQIDSDFTIVSKRKSDDADAR
jgi:hypothetical protein